MKDTFLSALLEDENISDLLLLPDDASCYAALSRGEARYWLTSRDQISMDITGNSGNFQDLEVVARVNKNFVIAFSSGTPNSTILTWQNAVEDAIDDGTFYQIISRAMPYLCQLIHCESCHG